MKTHLSVFAFLFLIISNIAAKDDVPDVFNMNAMDTVWQAKNNKVCKKDTATYYKVYRISDEPGLYTVNQYYVTGELYMTGRVTSVKPEHRDGDFYWFYKDGRKQRKTTYKNDREYKTDWYDPNGLIKLPCYRPVWDAEGKMAEELCFIDKYPEFPGGMSTLMKYLNYELKYPLNAKRDRAEGRVEVKIIIDENGIITNAEIKKKINPYLEAEALRVVRKMPAWFPAINEGKPVSSILNLPIVFKLPQN